MCVGGATDGSALRNIKEQQHGLPNTQHFCHQHQVHISWDPNQEDRMQEGTQGLKSEVNRH